MKKRKETVFIICLLVCIVCMILAGYFALMSETLQNKTSPVAPLLMGVCLASFAIAIKTPTQKGNRKLQRFFKPLIVLSIASILLAAVNVFAHGRSSEILSWAIFLASTASAIILYARSKGQTK
jgi:peptidoglycan/LPS O-acetylase OafA/YrhL